MTDPAYFVTPEARLSFPSLYQRRQRSKQDASAPEKHTFQATLLFPPSTDLSPVLAAMRHAMQEKWGTVFPPAKLQHFPIHKAEEKDYDGYEPGWHFIAFHNKRRPAVVDRENQPVEEERGLEMFYPGCWVRVFTNPFAWGDKREPGMSLSLNGIQFLRDDEPFTMSAASGAREAFEALGPVDGPAPGKNDFDFGI